MIPMMNGTLSSGMRKGRLWITRNITLCHPLQSGCVLWEDEAILILGSTDDIVCLESELPNSRRKGKTLLLISDHFDIVLNQESNDVSL